MNRRWFSGVRSQIADSFRWMEYLFAGVLVFALAIPLYNGLVDMYGPVDRYQFNDPTIYDWRTEGDFVEFLRDVAPLSQAQLREQLQIYRYHHSWRSTTDAIRSWVWIILAVGFPGLAVTQIFRMYRRFKFRERFRNLIDPEVWPRHRQPRA